MNLAGLTLHVADVETSLEFYGRLPGAEVLFHLPEQFALLRIGEGRLGLLQDNKRSFHVEIDCPDLDATCAELKKAGFESDGPTSRSWGEREAWVFDPDGNLLEFGQSRPKV